MDMHPLDQFAEVPPFEQIRAQLARRAAEGELEAGQKLPTVRALATELGVAVNTVARAYKELEADGVVVTEGRRGTFIASHSDTSAEVAASAAAFAASARHAGLTRHDATRLLDEAWDQSTRT
ncbi:GntR family transcriptional regulator [Nocardioides salsibiostraticola]